MSQKPLESRKMIGEIKREVGKCLEGCLSSHSFDGKQSDAEKEILSFCSELQQGNER